MVTLEIYLDIQERKKGGKKNRSTEKRVVEMAAKLLTISLRFKT